MPEFHYIKDLGAGSYGQVVLSHCPDNNQVYAVKRISKDAPHYKKSRVINEVKSCQMKHSNIVRIYFHIEDAHWDYLVMDYIRGVDLLQFLETNHKINERTVLKLFKQIYGAVTHCHSQGVAHRDLKLENIMVDKDLNITIIDFGLSHVRRHDQEEVLSTDWCGTMEYAAPEVLLQLPHLPSQVDVWCLGVILYALLFKRYPFRIEERQGLKSYDRHPSVIFPTSDHPNYGLVSHGAQDLIGKLLTADPKNRISMEDIATHPWMCSVAPSVPSC